MFIMYYLTLEGEGRFHIATIPLGQFCIEPSEAVWIVPGTICVD
jgi:hypothetical protein